MYPKPQKMSFGADWLGGVSKFADIGFKIYNSVKKFIPGGSKAGAGAVPGSKGAASLMLTELVDMGGAEDLLKNVMSQGLDKALDGSGMSFDDLKNVASAAKDAKSGDWGAAKEVAAGLGKNILGQIKKSANSQEENLNDRLVLWRQAINMCEDDKQSFKQTLIDTNNAIKKMAQPINF